MSFSVPVLRALPLAAVLALAPCPGTAPAEAPEDPAVAPARVRVPAAREPASDTPAAPPREAHPPVRAAEAPALVRVAPPLISPLTPRVAATLRAIAERAPRRDDVYAVMGGSSSVSRAFMSCFAGEEWDLAGYAEELGPTVAFFGDGNAAGQSPYRRGRSSQAARVGWSLRNVLAGRPSRILREVRAISPRYALVLFGGNDVEGRNPRVWGERLETTLRQLTAAGVIPIVGATLPRLDVDFMDAWAQRYNVVSRGIAHAWGVPYVDYYEAVGRLPGRGLARDGVHPNVYVVDGRGRGCILSDAGLRHGHNVRNLLTLRSLEAVRRVVAGAPASAAEAPPLTGSGSADDPLRLRMLPFATRWASEDFGEGTLDEYACAGAESAPGPERVFQLRLDEPARLVAHVYATRGVEASLRVLGAEADPAGCRLAGDELEPTLAAGEHTLVLEVRPDARARPGGSATLVLDVAPPRAPRRGQE